MAWEQKSVLMSRGVTGWHPLAKTLCDKNLRSVKAFHAGASEEPSLPSLLLRTSSHSSVLPLTSSWPLVLCSLTPRSPADSAPGSANKWWVFQSVQTAVQFDLVWLIMPAFGLSFFWDLFPQLGDVVCCPALVDPTAECAHSSPVTVSCWLRSCCLCVRFL